MITRLWNKFSETYWQYKFSGSNVRISNSDGFVIGKGSTIQNSNVFVGRDACFFIGAHCILKNVDIYIEKGCVIIDDYAILISENRLIKQCILLVMEIFMSIIILKYSVIEFGFDLAEMWK